MPAYYTYLISSLPTLQFQDKPPFLFSKFIQICRTLIPDRDVSLLLNCSLSGEKRYEGSQPTLKKWEEFDRALRNELVKIRSSHMRTDADKYLRRDTLGETNIRRVAIAAYRNPSILEAEKMLDSLKWQKLNELSSGHYFDLDCLICYALKLLILERWAKIHSTDKSRAIEETLRKN